MEHIRRIQGDSIHLVSVNGDEPRTLRSIGGNGGGGGTKDYNALQNLPSINGTTVQGNKTLTDYGLMTEMSSALNGKVDKVSGKGLSSNDYTNADKSKLNGIEAGAKANVNADWNAVDGDALILNKPTIPTVPTDVSAFNNDVGYVNATQAANAAPVQSVNGSTGAVTVSVPSKVSQLQNDSGFVNSAGAASAAPVQSVNGQTGSVSLTIPTVPNDVSAFNNDSGYVDSAGAAAAAPVQSVNGATGDVVLSIPATAADIGAAAASHTHGFLKNDGTFASQAVVASGDYLVITDKGDGYKMRHCTIQFGSSTTQYLANNGTWQNVPTAVSDLTNDSGFLTLADLPIYNGGVS